MRELQEKRRIKRILFSKPSAVVLGLLLLYFISSVWGVYGKYRSAEKSAELSRQDLHELEIRKSGLTARLDRLKTDRGVEDEIRRKFMVARPGEQVIVIVDSKEKQIVPLPPEESVWTRFLDIFR